MVSGCEHAPSANPRHAGFCVRCGRPIPVEPTTRPRNLDFERESVECAARGVMDPAQLWAQMLARSTDLADGYVADSLTVALDRDRVREVREELEDAFNHANWWLEANLDHPRALERVESLKWLCALHAAWSDDI